MKCPSILRFVCKNHTHNHVLKKHCCPDERMTYNLHYNFFILNFYLNTKLKMQRLVSHV